jgi:hypothetical protein
VPVPTLEQIERRFRPAVQRDLLRRGGKVRRAAQDNLRGYGGHIRRVRTGDLLRSIVVTPRSWNAIRIGSPLRRARWVHDGTGIFGPRRERIYPRHAKALRWRDSRTGDFIFARSIRGMRPNAFLVDALQAARDGV